MSDPSMSDVLAAIMGLGREVAPIRGSVASLEMQVDNVVGQVQELTGQQEQQKDIMEFMNQKFAELENELRLAKNEMQVLKETRVENIEDWERSPNLPEDWRVKDSVDPNLPPGRRTKQSSSSFLSTERKKGRKTMDSLLLTLPTKQHQKDKETNQSLT